MKPLSMQSSFTFAQGYKPHPHIVSFDLHEFFVHNAGKKFKEGTPAFDELRFRLLNETEHSLQMSMNCYARALEGLRSGSSYWSAVTLYYAAFFGAKTIMGLFGCWMSEPKSWLDVNNSKAGSIVLEHHRSQYSGTGSHKVLWEAYYSLMNSVGPFFSTKEGKLARDEVSGNPHWLIETRNDLNYHPQYALKLARDFEAHFDPANIPGCFSGRLQTLYQVSRALVRTARDSAARVKLSTEVWKPDASRNDFLEKHMLGEQAASLRAFYSSEVPAEII